MRIAEIYKSVQGEGLLAGRESVFVRTSGCNLRCRFCDTPFTSWVPEGRDLSIEAIVAQVTEWNAQHVVITGGEPMLYSELIPLTQALRRLNRHITIETAGTLYLPVVCDLMSISPKLSNSTPLPREASAAWHRRHDRTRHQPAVIRRLVAEYQYQFKFVVESKDDCDEVAAYLGEIPEIAESRVMLMPQGTTAEEMEKAARWLVPYCKLVRWRYCPRLQIEWFGRVRGT